MLGVKIVSTGYYLPPTIQTAAELAPLVGKSEKWIIKHTGVAERRLAGEETMDQMAAKAAKQAIGDGPAPDCIINASATPLQLIPDSSTFIQRALGYSGIPSWSVHATCLSFFVALQNAAALVNSGAYKRILVVSAEAGTPFRDFDDPESAVLFGDAAAAAIIEPTPEGESSAILDWQLNTYPAGAELTEFRGAGTLHPPGHPTKTTPKDNLFQMKGQQVYRQALVGIRGTLKDLFERNGVTTKDFNRLILHQASGPAIQMSKAFGFTPDQTVNIIGKVGNTIAASIPLVLATANEQGLLKRGDLLLVGGTGAGLSIGFSILKW